jgi:hypothetical protein
VCLLVKGTFDLAGDAAGGWRTASVFPEPKRLSELTKLFEFRRLMPGVSNRVGGA